MSNDDMELVRQYAVQQSESAFAALVSRHANLVYSAALRRLDNPQLAEEATQAVFVLLARKASSLDSKTILPSWLYRTACFVAMSAHKCEQRRQIREQEAFMHSTLNESQTDEAWGHMAPILEEAMLRLSQADQTALVLRFFQGCSLNEVGATMGTSEEAAKKRVNRALDKLRHFFTRRGVVASAALIAGTLSANSVQAAPAALANTVTALAIAKGAGAGGSALALAQGALKLMAWAKVKTALLFGACALTLAGTPILAVYELKRPPQGIPSTWSVLDGTAEQWRWADGRIHAHSTESETILAAPKMYRDVTISATVSTTNREASFAVRMQDADNGYLVIFAPLGDNVLTGNTSYGRGMVRFHKKTSGKEVVVNAYAGQLFSSITSTAKLAVSAKGPWFEVLVNDVTVLRIKDTDFSSGLVGLRICGDEKYPCDAAFSDVTISEARS